MQRQLARLRAFAEAIAKLYVEADRKLAILEVMEECELAERLDGCAGLGGYYSLLTSLRCDLIRDIWAVLLDRDDRAPSIAHLCYEFDDLASYCALRLQYAETRFACWLDTSGASGCAGAGATAHVPCVDYWSASLAEFDDTVSGLRLRVQSLLASDRARRLSVARNRGIAHYNMVKGRDKEHALFDLSTLRLELSDSQLVLEQAEPSIIELTRLLGGPVFDVAALRRLNQVQAGDFWTRLLGPGEKVHPNHASVRISRLK